MHKTTVDYGDRKIVKKMQGYLEEGNRAEFYHFNDGTVFIISNGDDGKPRISCNRKMNTEIKDGHIYRIVIS